jgi:hypothetical protein
VPIVSLACTADPLVPEIRSLRLKLFLFSGLKPISPLVSLIYMALLSYIVAEAQRASLIFHKSKHTFPIMHGMLLQANNRHPTLTISPESECQLICVVVALVACRRALSCLLP